MKRPHLLLTAIVLTSLLSCSSCNKNDSVSGHDHHHHNHNKTETDNSHSGDEIVVNPEIAAQMGVATEIIKKAPLNFGIKAIGSITLSPGASAVATTPVSGVITFVPTIELGRQVSAGQTIAKVNTSSVSGGDANRAAKAAYDAAKAEVERLKPLYDERLVTASQYNDAVKILEQSRAAYSSNASSGIITAPVSGYISSIDVASGQYVDAGTAVANISSTSENITLKVDVPQRHFKDIAAFNDAVIISPFGESTYKISDLGGKRINSPKSQSTAINGGFAPLYFSLPNTADLPVGSNVEVFLSGIGEDETISVPVSALSEQQGQMYVFLRLDENCYKKRPVKTGRTDGERIEIIDGISGGDNIVVSGTTTIRIAESSGIVPEGHTHNH